MQKKTIVLILAFSFTNTVMSEENDPLQGRINTLECSEQEILAYVVPKHPDRLAPSYETYKTAHAETAIYGKALNDTGTCLGVLYGDMGELSEQLSKSMSGMLNGLPSIDEIIAKAANELSKSVCGRLNDGVEMVHDAVNSAVKALHRETLRNVNNVIGQRAMAGYVDDYLVEQDPLGLDLRYRQNGISNDEINNQMGRTMKMRWKRKLRELNRELPTGR